VTSFRDGRRRVGPERDEDLQRAAWDKLYAVDASFYKTVEWRARLRAGGGADSQAERQTKQELTLVGEQTAAASFTFMLKGPQAAAEAPCAGYNPSTASGAVQVAWRLEPPREKAHSVCSIHLTSSKCCQLPALPRPTGGGDSRNLEIRSGRNSRRFVVPVQSEAVTAARRAACPRRSRRCPIRSRGARGPGPWFAWQSRNSAGC
jgi:hypothetical protein